MCYSAQVRHAYKLFVRMFGATMSIKEFNELFFRRVDEPEAKLKIPNAVLANRALHEEAIAAQMGSSESGGCASNRLPLPAVRE